MATELERVFVDSNGQPVPDGQVKDIAGNPVDPAVCALARRLIVVKTRQERLIEATNKLIPLMSDFAECAPFKGAGLFHMDIGCYLADITDAAASVGNAHRLLCAVHKALKKLCEDNQIPIPQGGGGR